MKTRKCRQCPTVFDIRDYRDHNKQHCSQKCAKKSYAKNTQSFYQRNPTAMAKYNKTRIGNRPDYWKEKARRERLGVLAALGGKCIVCGVTNLNWLHVDYIPTTRNKPYRHSRHLSFVLKHITDFRILCANHHYELTLTGKIEGTLITQTK